MSRKTTSGKVLKETELMGIISDTIRNVNNGTIDPKKAKEIYSGARTMCSIVATKLKVLKMQQSKGGQAVKFLE